jgi:hypothetical protein
MRSTSGGFDALDPKWSGGRPKAIGEQIRDRICLIARTSPADWGITAFATWSLAKLREHLIGRAERPVGVRGRRSAAAPCGRE